MKETLLVVMRKISEDYAIVMPANKDDINELLLFQT